MKELRSKLKELEDPVHPVYIPFYPDKFIDSIEYQSCITLASAAKIPILVFFNKRSTKTTIATSVSIMSLAIQLGHKPWRHKTDNKARWVGCARRERVVP